MAPHKATLTLDKPANLNLADQSTKPTVRQKTHILDLATRLEQLYALVKVWRRRQKDRNALAELAPHMLRDIGVSPAEADAESRKPFWRA